MADEFETDKAGELAPEWTMTPEQKAVAKTGVDIPEQPSIDLPSNGEINIRKDHSFGDLVLELNKAGYNSERILHICREENLIGHGLNADVYAIPGVENYVLRVARVGRHEDRPIGEIKESKDYFPEYNVGQAVAEITENGMYFLKRQEGTPAGVPHGEKRRGGEDADILYQEHLKNAADMPQEAYDEFAQMLLVINERDHKFDPSKSNNVLVDTQNRKFNLVDINKRSEGSTYRNEIADMAVTLIDNAFAGKYHGSVPLEPYRRIILAKCIEAANKVGLPIPEKGDNSSLDYSFTLAGQPR